MSIFLFHVNSIQKDKGRVLRIKKTALSVHKSGVYLGFEITGANKKVSPVFLIDHFLCAVSYKPILTVIDFIKYTYQHERIFLF